MNILILGGGGREHALADALARSRRVGTLAVAPGNPGTAAIADRFDVDILDPAAVVAAARRLAAGLVVIGPEAPLAAGVSDALSAAGFRVFGPSRAAARLETSKAFAREVCDRAGIPSARWQAFDRTDAALAHLDSLPVSGAQPVVVKADGLAAGKGVVVASARDEAAAAIRRCEAFGSRIVLESFLAGEEASFFALCAGEEAIPLAGAEDYKRAFDGDTGPNTGGMGCASPTAVLPPRLEGRIMDRIVLPALREMARRGTPYRGVLYAGVMLRGGAPSLVEFNARFGDPECQAMLARLGTDLLDLLEPVAAGDAASARAEWAPGAALTVVLAAPGYPGRPERGSVIRGLAAAGRLPGVRLHHAGTARSGGELVASGGRVLNVTATGADLAAARARAYAGVAAVDWPEGRFRRDIGRRSLAHAGGAGEAG